MHLSSTTRRREVILPVPVPATITMTTKTQHKLLQWVLAIVRRSSLMIFFYHTRVSLRYGAESEENIVLVRTVKLAADGLSLLKLECF